MEDLLFVAGTLGFFALGLAYIRFCDGIIGPDPVDARGAGSVAAEEHAPVAVTR
jgi:hypothetical protein